MGNTQSSGRSQGQEGRARQSDHTRPDRSRSPNVVTRDDPRVIRRRTASSRSLLDSSRYSGLYNSLRWRSAPDYASSNNIPEIPYDITTDDTDGHESRPLVDVEVSHDADPAPMSNLVRSASTMSRLGSRLLPDPVMRGLLNSGEETAEEGEALREGTTRRRRPSVFERRAPSTGNERFHIGGTIRRHFEARSESRRSVRGPFPLSHSEHQRLQNNTGSQLDDENSEVSGEDTTAVQPLRSRSRFSRMRNSLSFPLSGLFDASQDRLRPYVPRSPTPHPGQAPSVEGSEQLLRNTTGSNHRHDIDNSLHELDAVEPETRGVLSASRITSGMTSIRRFPHGLRSRSTRLIRRGEHPPLSQVLQLAASAIAAQLSGNSPATGDGSRSMGTEAFDGSIQNFVQTLQEAATAQAGENIDLNASDGELPPVNFMRVFQFPNDENGTPIAPTRSGDSDRMDIDQQDRSVTLVLVGVRSMPNIQDSTTNEGGPLGPSLDTLLSLPFLPPANVLRNGSSGALFRRSDARNISRRRHSMTNFNFPAQYESQRHHRTRATSRRSSTEQPLLSSHRNTPASIDESPPGPHPPPSTPADVRSGHATPIRRPSSASAAQAPLLTNLEENRSSTTPISSAAEASSTTPRQRQRSDSEFARRPELGLGAARRNGVVEPDRPAAGAGRSWLIYVVGTNVSPDHPAFTMPSLFTDSPSYEDMQMLSTLLGPVKPPVATRDEINSAGGNYKLVAQSGTLLAQPLDGNDGNDGTVFGVANGDRCLVCLCDYEASEVVRQLSSCRHLFHRECIDEWLTTGRNSCPMCRGQGVRENSASGGPSTAPTGGESVV